MVIEEMPSVKRWIILTTQRTLHTNTSGAVHTVAVPLKCPFVLPGLPKSVRGAATHHAGITQVLRNTTAMSALITTTDGEY